MPDPLFDRVARALAGRYSLERELGHGGMGAVYLATDGKLHRQVAIKVLPPATRGYLGPERFRREVELAAKLSHPHIVPLFEAGDVDGILFYVMEYVEGETLRDRLDRVGPLSLEEALRITAEVADALQYAHERGIIHRDIKPANILLCRDHALVADFGIAKAVAGAPAGDSLTATGVSVGTAEYMSPEQAGGERRIDARTDVYSLAAVVYEMLAGEPPFSGPTLQAVVARVIADAPRPIRTVRPNLPPHVDQALGAGLAKVAADRPPTARAFVDMLVRPTAERPARPRRRVAIGAGAVLVAALVVWAVGRGARDARPPGMVLVPGGQFPLFGGDCPQCLGARDVRLESFYIDRTEVAVGAYAEYVAAGQAPAPWADRPPDALPVTGVMWAEAAGYCRWRDSLARLPTEQEWEAAARGPQAQLYPWGPAWEGQRTNADNIRTGLAPVGAFPSGASAAGALDLVGNAWEWTASAGPTGRGGEARFVIRGGAFNSPPTVATGIYRTAFPAAAPERLRRATYDKTGFRCVRSLGP